jgi:hypothetical protein
MIEQEDKIGNYPFGRDIVYSSSICQYNDFFATTEKCEQQ